MASLNTHTETVERVGCAGSPPGGQCGSSPEPRPSCAQGRQSGPAPQPCCSQAGSFAANEGQPGHSSPTGGVSPDAIKRLKRMEQRNRARARKAGVPVAPVDFIAVLQAQNWACCICGEVMDPELIVEGKVHESFAISLEHEISIGVGGGHVPGNVKGAHCRCNLKKGSDSDTTNAAWCVRMADKHAPVQKVLTAPDDKPAKAVPRLQSRGFDTTHTRKLPTKSDPRGRTVRREGV